MKKYVSLICCLLLLAIASELFVIILYYNRSGNKNMNLKSNPENLTVSVCQGKQPPMKALLIGDFINYKYKLTPKDEKYIKSKISALIMSFRTGNTVSLGDWSVEESDKWFYFVYRGSFIPVYNDATVEVKRAVCKSQLCGSKYTKELKFHNGGRDPILKPGRVYLQGIEIGFIVKMRKGKWVKGYYNGNEMAVKAFIRKAEGINSSGNLNFFE